MSDVTDSSVARHDKNVFPFGPGGGDEAGERDDADKYGEPVDPDLGGINNAVPTGKDVQSPGIQGPNPDTAHGNIRNFPLA